MKLTSFVAAAFLLAAPMLDAAAKDVSSPAETFVLKTGENSLSFGNDFANVAAGDTFADRFYFQLPGSSDFSSFSVTSTAAKKGTGLDLTGYGIYDAATNALLAAGTLTYLNKAGVADKWSLSATNLTAGSYYFQVSGKMLSTGGSFASNGVITVSAVPEPAMPLMLLGGLGVVAAVARRRKA
jgi:hypothetical protein